MEQYEVLDVMNREAAPALSLELGLKRSTELPTTGMGQTVPMDKFFRLDSKSSNTTETPAEYFAVRIYVDKRIRVVLDWINKDSMSEEL